MSRFDWTPEQAAAYDDGWRAGFTHGHQAGRKHERKELRLAAWDILRLISFVLRAEEAISRSKTLPSDTRFPHLYSAKTLRRVTRDVIRRTQQYR